MFKADQAEGPFLRGVEILSPEQSTKAIAQCEAAASFAQGAVDQMCTYFKTRRKEFPAYTEESIKDDIASFMELSKQASSIKTKLNQFMRDTEQRKSQSANV